MGINGNHHLFKDIPYIHNAFSNYFHSLKETSKKRSLFFVSFYGVLLYLKYDWIYLFDYGHNEQYEVCWSTPLPHRGSIRPKLSRKWSHNKTDLQEKTRDIERRIY